MLQGYYYSNGRLNNYTEILEQYMWLHLYPDIPWSQSCLYWNRHPLLCCSSVDVELNKILYLNKEIAMSIYINVIVNVQVL